MGDAQEARYQGCSVGREGVRERKIKLEGGFVDFCDWRVKSQENNE